MASSAIRRGRHRERRERAERSPAAVRNCSVRRMRTRFSPRCTSSSAMPAFLGELDKLLNLVQCHCCFRWRQIPLWLASEFRSPYRLPGRYLRFGFRQSFLIHARLDGDDHPGLEFQLLALPRRGISWISRPSPWPVECTNARHQCFSRRLVPHGPRPRRYPRTNRIDRRHLRFEHRPIQRLGFRGIRPGTTTRVISLAYPSNSAPISINSS